MSDPRGFASDNHSGVHPEVLAAIAAANEGHAAAYGGDEWTARLGEVFGRHFGPDARAYPVFNGTAANVLCLDAVTGAHDAVICAESAHMNVDECGAPERIAGVKLLDVATEHGKLTPADVGGWDGNRGDEHQVQPRVVSITQATELGTVYTAADTRAVADAAHERGMLVHLDGARLANAAAFLDASLGEITADAGVDLLSFGGTKNGLLAADAVVFIRPELAEGFEFVRKQLLHLASKMRFLSAQLEALLGSDLWLRNASHANEMAARLAAAVEAIDGVQITHPVESNAVFARIPQPAIEHLLETLPGDVPLHTWGQARDEVRWMCSWDTTPEDVDAFARAIGEALVI